MVTSEPPPAANSEASSITMAPTPAVISGSEVALASTTTPDESSAQSCMKPMTSADFAMNRETVRTAQSRLHAESKRVPLPRAKLPIYQWGGGPLVSCEGAATLKGFPDLNIGPQCTSE